MISHILKLLGIFSLPDTNHSFNVCIYRCLTNAQEELNHRPKNGRKKNEPSSSLSTSSSQKDRLKEKIALKTGKHVDKIACVKPNPRPDAKPLIPKRQPQ